MSATAAGSRISSAEKTTSPRSGRIEGDSEQASGGVLRDSSQLTSQPVMSGKVVDTSGLPSEGADVTLYAWPSNDVTESQEVGDTTNLQPVAYTTTTGSGTFDLRLTGPDQLAPYVGTDSIANLTAVATTASGHNTEADFSRELADTARGARSTESSSAHGVSARVLANPVADQSTPAIPADAEEVTMHLDAGSSSASGGPDSSDAARIPVQKSCVTTIMATYTPVWVLVGQNYSTNPYAKANFQYYTDAQSTLGVAVSASGKYGSFKVSGTSTKTASSGVDFPTTIGPNSRYHRTKYQFAKYRQTCAAPHGIFIISYSVRAYKYVSGSSEVAVNPITASKCTTFAAGSRFTADRTQSVTWTNGADMSAGIGIDLSAQTGYGTHARIQWDFPHAAHLCGTADYPGEGTFRQLRAGIP